MFTFSSHVPHDRKTIKKMIEGHTELKLSNKVTTMQMIYDLLDVSNGEITTLVVPNLSILIGRDASIPRIPVSLCSQLQNLCVTLSFQPKARRQLEALRTLLTAPILERLELNAAEHRTEAFLREEKYLMSRDDAASALFDGVQLPGMLQLPSPTQTRLAAIEEDGAAYGKCVFEMLTGVQQLPPPASIGSDTELEEALQKLLISQAEDKDGASLLPAAQQQAVVQTQPRNELSACVVRENASTAMARLKARPDFEFMTKEEWHTWIAILLEGPFSPSLMHLDMKVIIPNPLPPTCRFLSGLVCLETLCLTFCRIEDATLEALMPFITEMYSLHVLDLSRNRLINPDLSPLASDTHSLERLILTHNKVGGEACAVLFGALGTTKVLNHIDLSYNQIRTEGLSFDNLESWEAPNACLRIPAIFSPDEVRRISACMPDGSTLELVDWVDGRFFTDGSNRLLE